MTGRRNTSCDRGNCSEVYRQERLSLEPPSDSPEQYGRSGLFTSLVSTKRQIEKARNAFANVSYNIVLLTPKYPCSKIHVEKRKLDSCSTDFPLPEDQTKTGLWEQKDPSGRFLFSYSFLVISTEF